METSGCNFTNSQKESCAVSLMRDTIEELLLMCDKEVIEV